MNFRRIFVLVLPLGLALIAWWLWPHKPITAESNQPTSNPPQFPASSTAADRATVKTQPENLPPTADPGPAEIPVSLAAELNAPAGSIGRDLQMLNDVFISWRLDFPRLGNPWGENTEITAALTGSNPLRLPLIPRDHPAINAAGELCDRWGTPFRFHALASDRMELRSAGPDRKFGTEDDSLLTPP